MAEAQFPRLEVEEVGRVAGQAERVATDAGGGATEERG